MGQLPSAYTARRVSYALLHRLTVAVPVQPAVYSYQMSASKPRPKPSSHEPGSAGPSVVAPAVSNGNVPSPTGSASPQSSFAGPPPMLQSRFAPQPLPWKPSPEQNSSQLLSQQNGSWPQI